MERIPSASKSTKIEKISKGWFWGCGSGCGCLILLVIIIIGISACTANLGNLDTNDNSSNNSNNSSASREEKSALNKAKTYSNVMHMSKDGIYNQLMSEADGFKESDAQYAVDNLKANYKRMLSKS